MVEANRVIASATAQLERLQAIIAELDRVGLDADEARDVLDEAAATWRSCGGSWVWS